MKTRLGFTAVLLSVLIGCSRSDHAPMRSDEDGFKDKAPMSEPSGSFAQTPRLPRSEKSDGDEFVALGPQEGKEAPPGAGKPAKVARKIKYTADVKLITDEFDKTRAEIVSLIDKHHGYEALADVSSSPGAPRKGMWRVRVPIESFGPFREAVRQLAEVENDTVSTEDLTDQYYDLDANIRNLKSEQESWREMLKKTTDKLESLIAVKKELDRVTDEIMRKEGRLRLMANLTDLTTVTIHVRERQKFNPVKGPEPVEAATFGMKASKAFSNSWGALRAFGEGVALFSVAVAPWLPPLLMIGVPAWWWLRRRPRPAKTEEVPQVTIVS